MTAATEEIVRRGIVDEHVEGGGRRDVARGVGRRDLELVRAGGEVERDRERGAGDVRVTKVGVTVHHIDGQARFGERAGERDRAGVGQAGGDAGVRRDRQVGRGRGRRGHRASQVSEALPVPVLPYRSITPAALTVNVYVPSIGTSRLLKLEIANSVGESCVIVMLGVIRFGPPALEYVMFW